jgi:hypothetical protein
VNLIGSCNICSEKIYLCWGSVGLPYWYHEKDNCHNIYPHTVEMAEMAKQALYLHLRNKGGLMLETECQQCLRPTLENPTRKVQTVKDYVYFYYDSNGVNRQYTFDVAGLDSTGKIIYAIILWKLHSDYDLIGALKKPNLYLVDDIQILNKLDTEFTDIITLTNYFKRETCLRNYCVPRRELAFALGYLKTKDVSSKVPLLGVKETFSKEVKTSVREVKEISFEEESSFGSIMKRVESTLSSQDKFSSKDECSPKKEDKSQPKDLSLGEEDKNLSEDVWIFDRSSDQVKLDRKKLSAAWAAFLVRQSCLKCGTYYPEVRTGKPFCIYCHKPSMNNSIL